MSAGSQSFDQAALKLAAAAYAASTFVQSDMFVGLGSGSTAELFVKELGQRVVSGQLSNLITVSTSDKVAALAQICGLKVVGLDEVPYLDVTVDGADEIEPLTFGVTKGQGGALLREKLVAAASKVEVIIADESKLVVHLGEKMPVPVEVIVFGWQHTAGRLRALGCDPVLRLNNNQPYLTDSSNYILDCHFPPIPEASALATAIKSVVGVVEHGLFIGMAGRVVIAGQEGVYELERP